MKEEGPNPFLRKKKISKNFERMFNDFQGLLISLGITLFFDSEKFTFL